MRLRAILNRNSTFASFGVKGVKGANAKLEYRNMLHYLHLILIIRWLRVFYLHLKLHLVLHADDSAANCIFIHRYEYLYSLARFFRPVHAP